MLWFLGDEGGRRLCLPIGSMLHEVVGQSCPSTAAAAAKSLECSDRQQEVLWAAVAAYKANEAAEQSSHRK